MPKHPVLYAALLAIISSTFTTSATARECDLGAFSVPGGDGTDNNNGNSGEGGSPGNVINGNQTNSLGDSKSSLMLHNFDMKFATFPVFDPETGTFVAILAGNGDLPCQALMQVGGSNSAWTTSDKADTGKPYFDAFTFTSFTPSEAGLPPDGIGIVRKYVISSANGEKLGTLEFRVWAHLGGAVMIADGTALAETGAPLQKMPVGTHLEVSTNTTILAETLLTIRYWSGNESAPYETGPPLVIPLPSGSYVSQIQQGWFADDGFQGSGELVISSLPWTESPD